jgi:hypothetical protein
LHLKNLQVRPIQPSEETRYRDVMKSHHYLGSSPKIGETLLYVALYQDEWVALISFTSAAWKCAARDQWIGWDFRHQYDRLHLVTNNSRFLILPQWHYPNLASRILSLCQRRIQTDWLERFGHPLLLLETFVDPQYFHGTLYKATNWICVGQTKGFARTRQGYAPDISSPKKVFVYPLQRNTQKLLSQHVLKSFYRSGVPKLMLSAEHMSLLPAFFSGMDDPRRAQGRRHPLSSVLAIAAGAILCGRVGYKGISDWAQSLGQKARERFRCRRIDGKYAVPSESIIRNVLIGVDPIQLDHALQRWNLAYGQEDESLAIDGKTMCNAVDEQGKQTHIMSAIGHDSMICYGQKK